MYIIKQMRNFEIIPKYGFSEVGPFKATPDNLLEQVYRGLQASAVGEVEIKETLLEIKKKSV